MSYVDLLPIPGDLIFAIVEMRAWENEERKGRDGELILAGEQALVLAMWEVGNQQRLKLLRDDRILVFSCAEHCVRRNWGIAVPVPRLPTLGCP